MRRASPWRQRSVALALFTAVVLLWRSSSSWHACEAPRLPRDAEPALHSLILAVERDLAEQANATASLDWIPLTRLMRSYATLLGAAHRGPTLDAIEGAMFDWMQLGAPSLRKLRARWSGQGIVISAGDSQIIPLTHLLRGLREIVHCTLPIEVVFKGDADLSPASRALILDLKLDDVALVDASELLDFGKLALDNFSSKFASMLACSFETFVRTSLYKRTVGSFQSRR